MCTIEFSTAAPMATSRSCNDLVASNQFLLSTKKSDFIKWPRHKKFAHLPKLLGFRVLWPWYQPFLSLQHYAPRLEALQTLLFHCCTPVGNTIVWVQRNPTEKTSYNFSVMQCTDQFEASTSPAVRAKPPPHGEFKPYLGGVEIWTVGAVKSLPSSTIDVFYLFYTFLKIICLYYMIKGKKATLHR